MLLLLGAGLLVGCPDDKRRVVESPFLFDELERAGLPPTTVQR